MKTPGAASLLFLFYLFVFTPWKAYTSARRFKAARATEKTEGQEGASPALPSLEAIWIGTIFSLALLGFLAWYVGRSFAYDIFALPRLGIREVGAAVLALAACFGIRAVLRATRTEEERRGLAFYKLVPRTPRERVLSIVAILAAAVSEEAAYRGVAMAILWFSLGNPWLAAFLSALAFAVAHWMQGWKSGLAIFAIGLTMQALVAFTGTLILAMIVHALYDIAASLLIARQARADEARAAG